MFASLRSRIIIVITGIVFLTTFTIIIFVQYETKKAIFTVQDENTRNILNAVFLSVENEYKSLVFHENSMLTRRKTELKDIISIAMKIIEDSFELYKNGKLSETEAKENALNIIKKIRYNKDVGYIWINNTSSPIPRMIMHPTIPELDGKILDDKKFYCALGKKENLFKVFAEICEKQNNVFVDYLWPKPTKEGLTVEKQKISYGEIFRPWGWIVGTGLYIDDIEEEVNEKRKAILNELKETFKKTRVANSGYMYLFDCNQNMLIHPTLEGKDFLKLINPVTGNPILEDLMSAEKTELKQLDYLWDKPPNFKGIYKFWKRSYIVYFEPLKWYIASSVYFDEQKKPAEKLQKKLLIISSFFFLGALILAQILSKSLSSPILKLMHATKEIEEKGFSSTIIPLTGTLETKELGKIFAHLIKTLQIGLKEKEVLLQEIHHRVKNNMAVIISLLGLQSRNVNDKTVKAALTDSQNRIKSMSLIHESLYQSKNLSQILLKSYVSTLVNSVLAVMNFTNFNLKTFIEVDEVKLTINQAVPCGLILNELITNSLKYAFINRTNNILKINAKYSKDQKFVELEVHDNGVGFPENIKIEEIKSTGLKIISLLVQNQLEGELSIRNEDGALVYMRWPNKL